MKIIRTDAEIQTPLLDDTLRNMGHELLLLEEHVTEVELQKEIADTDLLLMCYTPITRWIIEAAGQLKGIVKYGVGICLLYTSPSPRDKRQSRMPSSA